MRRACDASSPVTTAVQDPRSYKIVYAIGRLSSERRVKDRITSLAAERTGTVVGCKLQYPKSHPNHPSCVHPIAFKMKTPARNHVVLGAGIIFNMVLLSLTLRMHISTPRVVSSQSQYAWQDNKFSMATSGRLFHMQVQRRFANSTSRWQSNFDPADIPEANSSLDCTIWAVVTTISSPTSTIRQLQTLASRNLLCLVVIGDRKTPNNYTMGANAIYLSPEQQDKLPYRTIRHLPWNHFGRKNVGYLYAIHHRAQQIYDTDDDNELSSGFIPTRSQTKFTTIATAHALTNLYPCFGSKYASSNNYEFSWPRGFPLESIKDPRTVTCTAMHSTKLEFESVGVIQSLADNDPDVDAIYRLTRPLPVHFDDEGNNIIIAEGSFMPYNAQATIHDLRAMWGLLLPITVHGRVSDIWRSYFTQRIMWSAGLKLAMARPWVVQKRNAHNYLGDF